MQGIRPLLEPPGVVPRITELDRLYNELAGHDVTKLAQIREARVIDTFRTVVMIKQRQQKVKQR